MDAEMIMFWAIFIGGFGLLAFLYSFVSPFRKRSAVEFFNLNKIVVALCIILPIVFGCICIYLFTWKSRTDYIVLTLSILMVLMACFVFDLIVRISKTKKSTLLPVLVYLLGAAGFFFMFGAIAFWGY